MTTKQYQAASYQAGRSIVIVGKHHLNSLKLSQTCWVIIYLKNIRFNYSKIFNFNC